MATTALKRRLKIAALACAVGVVAFALGVWWLTGTQAGVRTLLSLGSRLPGIRMTAEEVAGTPAAGLSIGRLTIEHERVLVRVAGLRLHLDPWHLLVGSIDLPTLDAESVDVDVRPRLHPPDGLPVQFLPRPLGLTVHLLSVAHLRVTDGATPLVDAQQLSAGVGISPTRLRVVHAGVASQGALLRGEATLLAADPLGLAAEIDVSVPVAAGSVDVRVAATGDLKRLRLDATARAPAGVHFRGDLSVEGPPHADGVLEITDSTLAPLLDAPQVGRVSARLAVHGALDDFSVEGPVSSSSWPQAGLTVSLRAAYAARTLSVRSLALADRVGARAQAHGRVAWSTGSAPDLELDVGWQDLRWPVSGAARVESPSGAAHLAGRDDFLYAVNAVLRAPNWPAATLALRGRAGRDDVTLESAIARVLGGRLVANGRATWRGDQAWSLAAAGDRLDPGGLRPMLAGRVDFALQASGRGFSRQGEASVVLDAFRGRVRGRPVAGAGSLRYAAGEWQFDGARVSFASLNATAQGRWGAHSAIDAGLDVGSVGDFLDDGAGSLHVRASFTDGGAAHLTGSAQARGLRAAGVALDGLTASADLDASSQRESTVSVQAHGLSAAGAQIDSIEAVGHGTAASHTVSLGVQAGARRAELRAHGHYASGLAGELLLLDTLTIDAPRIEHYVLLGPVELRVRRDAASLEHLCLSGGDSSACLAFDWRASGPWSASMQATGLPLGLLPLPLPAGSGVDGAVSFSASVAGHGSSPPTGQASADLDGIVVHYPTARGKQSALKIGNGRIAGELRSDTATLHAAVSASGDSFLAIDASADRSATTNLALAPLAGTVHLRTRELGYVPVVLPDIDRMTGLLQAELTLGGTLQAPLLSGSVALSEGEVDIYLSNLKLRDIAARADVHGQSLDLDVHARAAQGSLAATGDLRWLRGEPTGSIHFTGDHLLVADLPEARVVASPDLRLDIAGHHVEAHGEVAMPTARIAPRDMSGAARVSTDQVLVGAGQQATAPQFTVDSEVRFTLGPDVRIEAYGLKGLLQGSLTLTAKTHQPITGTGEVEVKDGHYLAYARELDVERGRLLFRGGPVDNAGLDIRASRKLPGYTAGVNVRGTLQSPQLSFFSDPPLPQSQIASLLLVGQTTDVGQGATAAGSLLAAQGGALLIGDYTHYLGIDQMTIEADATNGTALVLGKFLTPRLYASYGVSLAQAINTFKLRYTIGDSWVVNVESGVNHSADIQYSFQR